MSNVYVEPRPKGRPEGTHIDDYVVEDHADHALATFKTQGEAIDWAKKNGHGGDQRDFRRAVQKVLLDVRVAKGPHNLILVVRARVEGRDTLAASHRAVY